MYISRFFTALAVVVVAAGFGVEARAGYVTSNGTVQLTSEDTPVAPLFNIQQLSGTLGDGFIYTNQVSGSAFTSGEVRTISVQRFTTATDGISPQSGLHVSTGVSMLGVSALIGTIVAPGTVHFTSGEVFLFGKSGSFVPSNPSNWPLPAEASLLAQYKLITDSVLSGPDYTPPVAGTSVVDAFTTAALMNISGVSVLSGLPVGQFLFGEDSRTSQNSPTNGVNFIRDVELPGGGLTNLEGLYVTINQTILSTRGLNGMDATDLADLNAIAARAGFSDLLGPGTGFATGFGTNATGISTDFYAKGGQVGATNGPATGDFFAQLRTDANIAANVVPEPGSITLFALGMVGLAAFRIRRRRNS